MIPSICDEKKADVVADLIGPRHDVVEPTTDTYRRYYDVVE